MEIGKVETEEEEGILDLKHNKSNLLLIDFLLAYLISLIKSK